MTETPAVQEAQPGVFGAVLGLITNPAHVRVCGSRALTVDPPTTDACEPHTPAPSGYLAWQVWAERKARTHVQERCPGCGLWKIWRPKNRERETHV